MNSHAQAFEVQGTISYSTTHEGFLLEEKKHFTVSRDQERWNIRTSPVGPASQQLSSVLYDEAAHDGTNTYYLKRYDPADFEPPDAAGTPARAMVMAQGRVQEARFPHSLELSLVYPLWLAYCSSDYLLAVGDGRLAAPLFVPTDFYTDPVPLPFYLPAEWTLNDSAFVSRVRWYSEGTYAEYDRDGSFQLKEWPPPYDAGFPQASFETTEWTACGGLVLPAGFRLRVFAPRYSGGDQAATNLDVSFVIRGSVESVGSETAVTCPPRIASKTSITDSRVYFDGSPVTYVDESQWATLAEVQSKLQKVRLGLDPRAPASSKRRVVVLLMLVISAAVLWIAVLRVFLPRRPVPIRKNQK